MTILIDGYDFTEDIIEIPTFDFSIPEWGELENSIINEIIELRLDIRFKPFFISLNKRKFKVLITNNNIILFNGFIDIFTYDLTNIILSCKSETSVLFNSNFTIDSYAYVIDNAYPSAIIKEILDLTGLNFNELSYKSNLSYDKSVQMTFNVTAENIKYSEILQKVCEVSCGYLYLYNDEFYFERYTGNEKPTIEIDSNDWIDYPVIELEPRFGSIWNGVEVKFGSGILLNNLENSSLVIDMSNSSSVYTSMVTTAVIISDLYNSLGSTKKYKLTGSLKKSLETLFNKTIYFKWDGLTYKIININTDSKVLFTVTAESI